MYIPTTFMSSKGSCIRATATEIAGNGFITTGSFVSGGVIWDYYQFEMDDKYDNTLTPFTASLNILTGSTAQARILMLGGGGSGGSGPTTGGGINLSDIACGGGGGGGVVYYEQIPIFSGSYRIEIGGATLPVNASVGAKGQDTKFYYENEYSPFTSSIFIALGGGGGGVGYWNSSLSGNARCIINYGPAGGTGGGIGRYGTDLVGACNVDISGGSPEPNWYKNIQYAPQGYEGGFLFAEVGPSSATGGGGAGTAGVTLPAGTGFYASNGGDGFGVNMNGTFTYYGPGGGGQGFGQATQDTASPGAGGSDAYGRGGQGERDNTTTDINKGLAGIVIVAIPRCTPDLNICSEYTIAGGATGGTLSFIPCGTDDITTASIDFGYTGSVCSVVVGGYPSATGTVTLTQTGSCNTYIPLQPDVTCGTGSVKTPVNIYDFTVNGTCYPTALNCQRYFYASVVANYVDVNGVSQSIEYGPFFGGPTYQIQLCARDIPTPTVNGNSGTKTSLICGYYCSGSI